MYDFNDFVGHNTVVSRLKTLIRGGRFPHSVIIDGGGKTTLSKIVAKTLLCETGNAFACNKCLSCLTFESGNNPDIFYVTTEKAHLGVDDIREQIVKNMDFAPYSHRYKIFIIKNADEMTIAAQNALLKTIEEPKEYGKFILLSSNTSGFLPTVISRSVVFMLKPLRDDVVSAFLMKRGYGKTVSDNAALLAKGSVKKALLICGDESFQDLQKAVFRILSVALEHEKDPVYAFNSAVSFSSYKDKITEVLDMMENWYRDVLLLQTTGNPVLFLPDCKEDTKAAAGVSGASHVFSILEAIEYARQSLRSNGNFNMTMETLMLVVCGYNRKGTIENI